jgi:hypothetical protein
MTHYGLDPSRLTLVADAQSALGEVRIGREPASRAARGRPAKPKVEAALTCREMVADAPANRSG